MRFCRWHQILSVVFLEWRAYFIYFWENVCWITIVCQSLFQVEMVKGERFMWCSMKAPGSAHRSLSVSDSHHTSAWNLAGGRWWLVTVLLSKMNKVESFNFVFCQEITVMGFNLGNSCSEVEVNKRVWFSYCIYSDHSSLLRCPQCRFVLFEIKSFCHKTIWDVKLGWPDKDRTSFFNDH